jgi:hypothetical protein
VFGGVKLADVRPPERRSSAPCWKGVPSRKTREVEQASILRLEAATLLKRADQVKDDVDRETLLLWAKELNEKAEELERAAAPSATKH